MALAVSAFLAARSAILAARAEVEGAPRMLLLNAPLTPAAVQAACLVDPQHLVME